MTTNTDRIQGPLIIIDKKTRTVEEVQSRIAELNRDQPDVDTAYTAALIRRADLHNELEALTNALVAGGFPIQSNSQ